MIARALTLVATVVWLGVPAVSAQPPTAWQPALDLYAAAAYDEALQALDALDRESLDDDGVVAVEQHRMLCLVALGRVAAAEQAAAALLAVRPGFVLAAREVSPRVRAMFDATRRQVLPDLARRHYAEAKRAYDAGAHQRAHDGFATVASVLAGEGLAEVDGSLDDLRVLADGFRQLSAAALDRAAPAADAAAHAATAADAAPHAATTMPHLEAAPLAPAVPSVAAAAPASPPSPPFTPLDIFTYDWRDKDVVPPTPVAQPISGWWGSMGEPAPGTRLGVVDLVVDEHGTVADAYIYQSVNRVYDAVLLASVKHWRYAPATRDGRAVKYRRVTGVVSHR